MQRGTFRGWLVIWLGVLALACQPVFAAEAADHDEAAEAAGHEHEEEAHEEGAHEHEEDGHGEEGVLRMSPDKRKALGIIVAPAEPRALKGLISAPGEVRLDAYRTLEVTPRITAQVIGRHARLGDRVERGQRLVTLSSVEMADAQGELIEADREWQRVRRLGRKAVSEKRYIAAQVARQLAWARVRAYGMSEAQIRALLQKGDATQATGRFDLFSTLPGRVIRDDFRLGEVVEPGRILFEVSDDRVVWVEAQLEPDQAARVRVGMPARISPDGESWLEGKVIRKHHRLDEETRTLAVRIEIMNPEERVHPGEYVDVLIEADDGLARVAVPEAAVVLMQGAPTVFRVEGDELHPVPVETGITRGGWTEIRVGLAPGDPVVVQGAFFLKSLLLKSQMGEGHAH